MTDIDTAETLLFYEHLADVDQSVIRDVGKFCAEIDRLRARLAEVEAERDRWHKMRDAYFASSEQEHQRAEAAEARLAAVEALCDTSDNWEGAHSFVLPPIVNLWCHRCAKSYGDPIHSGEGDRPATYASPDPTSRGAAQAVHARDQKAQRSGEGDRGTWPHCTHCGNPPRLCGADDDGFHRVACIACESATDQRTCGCKGKPFQVCDTCQNWVAARGEGDRPAEHHDTEDAHGNPICVCPDLRGEGDDRGPQGEEAAEVCCYDGLRPCEYPQCARVPQRSADVDTGEDRDAR